VQKTEVVESLPLRSKAQVVLSGRRWCGPSDKVI
jgi:hypothetical protein